MSAPEAAEVTPPAWGWVAVTAGPGGVTFGWPDVPEGVPAAAVEDSLREHPQVIAAWRLGERVK